MKYKYLFFDMDNTLTLSRQEALPEMVRELERIKKKYHISIASGAELKRMLWQVPIADVTWFAQNGNELFEHNQTVWVKELPDKEEIYNHINLLVNYYCKDYPNYEIEDRGSEIVISFTGFHAPFGIKHTFDPDRKIRLEMLQRFPHPNAYVAGSSGIDYIPFTKGENIKNYLTKFHINPTECLYIGDALDPGMNDHTVVGVIPTFAVKNPTETLEFIKQL
jgi:HAD superfamily hydrolase (TIGR01484 family)